MVDLASLALLIVVSVGLLISPSVMAANAKVTITIVNQPVISGETLAIKCEMRNPEQDNLKISLFRVVNSKNEQITNGQDILKSQLDSKTFLATRTFPGEAFVYFYTVIAVSYNDKGRYICKVFDVSTFEYIAEDSIDLKTYSHPRRLYPRCTSDPIQPVTVGVDDTLKLKCTSESGAPHVEMKWINTQTRRFIATRNSTVGDEVLTESTILVNSSLQNIMFACEITSVIFPDWKRSCTVGPINVVPYMTSPGLIPNSDPGDFNSENILNLHSNCVECTSDDMLQFHLTIAIVATAFLAIIFVITTIVLCYRYHEPPVTRRPPSRALMPQQSVEPVYVSLQRRSVNADREYMTLEDPNNPDNKIIVPRETFDEYCKTMTMKGV